MKIEEDKVYHFVVSLILALLASTLIANLMYAVMPDNPGCRAATSYGAALFATLAVGVAKEFRDKRQAGNRVCWRDLGADLVGALIGSVGALVTLLL